MLRILTLFATICLWATSAAAEVGDDGLHKADWIRETFKDLREDHMPSDVADDATAMSGAAAAMPGAFGKWTTLNLLNWIADEGYTGDEAFQRYHARVLQDAGIVE